MKALKFETVISVCWCNNAVCTSLLDWPAQILAESRDRRHEAESIAEIDSATLQEGGSSL